jgi:hypothetical protein
LIQIRLVGAQKTRFWRSPPVLCYAVGTVLRIEAEMAVPSAGKHPA